MRGMKKGDRGRGGAGWLAISGGQVTTSCSEESKLPTEESKLPTEESKLPTEVFLHLLLYKIGPILKIMKKLEHEKKLD
jgi:hypothetical protein